MNCPECEALLQCRLDGDRIMDRAAVERHLFGCTLCRERHAAAALLLDEGLSALLRPVPPHPLWSAEVVSNLLADQRRRRWRRYRVTAVASAAALLLAVLTGWSALRWSQPVGPEPIQQAQSAEKQEGSSLNEMRPSLGETVTEAERAVKALTNRIADNTVGQMRTLLNVAAPAEVGPMPELPTMASIEQPLDPAARSLQETGRGVSTGLQTVAGSARRAFDFLLREMPPVAR
jgi:predicted anti-sigma-YlaC factor YlaD